MKTISIFFITVFIATAGAAQNKSPFPGMQPIEKVLVNENYGGDFHKAGCTELKKKTKEIRHEDAQVNGYMPCSLCFNKAIDYYYKPEEGEEKTEK